MSPDILRKDYTVKHGTWLSVSNGVVKKRVFFKVSPLIPLLDGVSFEREALLYYYTNSACLKKVLKAHISSGLKCKDTPNVRQHNV